MLPKFEYIKPQSISEAIEHINKGEAKFLAGGTDLIVKMRERKIVPQKLIDLNGLNDLKGIHEIEDEIWIGAMSTMWDIYNSPILKKYTALTQGARVMGCHEIRLKATIGGNVCNASPSGDASVPLLLYDTIVVIEGADGERKVSLSDFFKGYGKVDLKDKEIVKGFLLTKQPCRSRFFRSSRVKGMDLSSVSLAIGIKKTSKVEFYISMGAVRPMPVRIREVEELLKASSLDKLTLDIAGDLLKQVISPRDGSLRATPWYKKEIAEHFLKDGLSSLLKEEK